MIQRTLLTSIVLLFAAVLAAITIPTEPPASPQEIALSSNMTLPTLSPDTEESISTAAQRALIAQEQASAAEQARIAAEQQTARDRAARIAATKARAAARNAALKQVPPPTATDGDIWRALANCESASGADSPNGLYHGFFQFRLDTWRSVGGTGDPHTHSYETQKSFAQKLQARSGFGQWPRCSDRLGLR